MQDFFSDIIIIDDDKLSSFITEARFKKNDPSIQIRVFENPPELLKKMETTVIETDLIVLDINMPLMDAWEFLDHIKVHKLLLKQKIVILSSSSLQSDQEKASLYPNVIGCIEKPLNLEKIKLIRKLFSK